jgi:hypothetical protein
MLTFGDDLSPDGVVMTGSDETEVDVILPAWHQPVNDDDGLVCLLVYTNEDPLPW